MSECTHPNENIVIITSAVNHYEVTKNGKVLLKFADNEDFNVYCEKCEADNLQDSGFTMNSSKILVRPELELKPSQDSP